MASPSSGIASLTLDTVLDDNLDTIVRDFRQAASVPGVSLVATLRANADGPADTIYRCYGMAFGDQPIMPTTRLPLCSITKHFISLALLRLLHDRGMTEETSVRAVLPRFRLANEAQGKATVTFAHVLSHTTGMETNNGFWIEMLATGEDFFDYLARQPCAHRPGEVFYYANVMYDLCIPAIESLSGESVEAYLDRVFFAPLGMARTGFSGEGGQDAAEGHIRGVGHEGPVVLPFGEKFGFQGMPSRLAWKGAAELVSCAEDMGKWLAYLPTDPFYPTLVKPRIAAYDSIRPGNSMLDAGEQYGLGMFVGTLRGVPYLEHWAAIAGFSGLLTCFPTLGLSLVSLSNSWDARELGSVITGAVVCRILGKDQGSVVNLMTKERLARMAVDEADFAPVSGLEPTEATRLSGTYLGAAVDKLVFDDSSNVKVRPLCSIGPWLPFLHGDIKPVVAYLRDGKYAACLAYTQWRRDGDETPAEVKYCHPFRMEKAEGVESLLVEDSYFSPPFTLRRAEDASVEAKV